MTNQVKIETERLVLRTVSSNDIEAVAYSWQLDEGPITQEEAGAKINWMFANHSQNTPGRLVHLCLAIIEKSSQEIIGWCGLDHRVKSWKNPVLFYLLKERCWGQGLATEAARALLRYAFSDLALPQIDAAAAQENLASRRVLEKIGMQYTGADEEGGCAYTITQGDWVRQVG